VVFVVSAISRQRIGGRPTVSRHGKKRPTMKIELPHRIRELPPYLFAKIDALKNEERKKGRDLIDLGIGDPDLPTPAHIVEALATAARDPGTHRYPSY